MKRLLALAFAIVVAGACAHQPRQDQVMTPLKHVDKEILAALEPFCLPHAMHAALLLPADAPEKVKREEVFRDYYEAFLDAKEQSDYVSCLRRRYALPWLHADYRKGKRWLNVSRAQVARDEPLAGKRIADVAESFADAGAGKTLRRVTVTLEGGEKTVVEETFSAN